MWDLRKNFSNLRCMPTPIHKFAFPEVNERARGMSSERNIQFIINLVINSCQNPILFVYSSKLFNIIK